MADSNPPAAAPSPEPASYPAKMTGPQRKKLCQALQDAFPSPEEVAQLVSFGLSKNWEIFVKPGELQFRIFDLVNKCETRGWLMQLLAAAREENPGNQALELVIWDLNQESGVGYLPPETPAGELQKVVIDHSTFQDPESWLLSMAGRLKTVCRVESSRGQPEGTGFLVGPSLVMTNCHVADAFENEVDPIFRFDYRVLPDGKPLRSGVEYQLKGKNFLKCKSPVGKLDYALVELKGTPGKDSPGQGPKSTPRGWLKPTAYDFQKGEPMVIVQHPRGRQLEMAFGSVLDSGGQRVVHSVSTQDGSSGSPCFNASLELVALHYWGSDAKNAAIRFSSILKDLADNKSLIE